MGSPGTEKALYDVPFSLTEEFVAVYRMHPLIPDVYEFRAAADDHLLATRTLPELGVQHVRHRMAEVGLADAFYSLGIANPGAITLNNYPVHLQHLQRADGELLDLAAVDIMRTRERGVPRYNDFRRLFPSGRPHPSKTLHPTRPPRTGSGPSTRATSNAST